MRTFWPIWPCGQWNMIFVPSTACGPGLPLSLRQALLCPGSRATGWRWPKSNQIVLPPDRAQRDHLLPRFVGKRHRPRRRSLRLPPKTSIFASPQSSMLCAALSATAPFSRQWQVQPAPLAPSPARLRSGRKVKQAISRSGRRWLGLQGYQVRPLVTPVLSAQGQGDSASRGEEWRPPALATRPPGARLAGCVICRTTSHRRVRQRLLPSR